VVRVSHTLKRPTSRKSAMVRRSLSNLSIQIIHEPPGGGRERIGNMDPLTRRRKPDKQVTNGVVGSISDEKVKRSTDHNPQGLVCGGGSLGDYLSTRICFSGLLAGLKDNGKGPKADGEIAVRATPEPQRASLVDRWRGHQCSQGGSGPVVAVGVTSHQGVRESRTQDKGGYTPTVPDTTVTASTRLDHGAIHG
jgi:hypothetical protein